MLQFLFAGNRAANIAKVLKIDKPINFVVRGECTGAMFTVLYEPAREIVGEADIQIS